MLQIHQHDLVGLNSKMPEKNVDLANKSSVRTTSWAYFIMAVVHAPVFAILSVALINFLASSKYNFYISGVLFTVDTVLTVCFLWYVRNKDYSKFVKSFSDVIWNTWAFIGIMVFLLNYPVGAVKIDEVMRQIGIAGNAMALGILIPAAAGKLAVSIVDTIILLKDKLSTKREENRQSLRT